VLAASEFAVGLDEIWKKSDASARPMAFTIGRFHTDPKEHALTKVAGALTLSLDVRAYDEAHLGELESAVLDLARDVGQRRGVKFQLGDRTSADVAPSHPDVFAKLINSAKALGIPAMPLASPASHDTATFTVAGVPSAMLFVRNANGSHNPREAMEIDDFLQAAAVLTYWLAAEATSTAT
jgi:N-carbamoyl-L-amino-acid hydrolase